MKYRLLSTLTVLCAACSSAPSQGPQAEDWSQSEGTPLSTPTFEQFKADSTKTIQGKNVFVVEEDMLFDSEPVLQAVYNELYVTPTDKSIINTVGCTRQAIRRNEH